MCVIQRGCLRLLIAFVALNGDKFKLEDAPFRVILAPAIDEVEIAVIRPNAVVKLFVNANDIRSFFARLELLCGL